MKLKLILLLFLLGTVSYVKADDAFTQLIIHFHDDERIKFALAEMPSLSFSDSELIIKTASVTVAHPLKKIAYITYEGGENSHVSGIKSDKSMYVINSDYISFPYLESGDCINIYTASGAMVLCTQVRETREYGLPISTFRSGIYIVTINNISFKIVVK